MDAITKHSNSLSDFFTAPELLSLNYLLNKIIDYGCCKLGCEGGSLFFFDGGTAKLELSAHSYSTASPLSFSLSPGEGVAGYAFIKQTLVIASGMELTRLYMPFKLFPRDRLRGVVALPVFVFKKPIAVFCFDFISEHLQPGMDQNAENLTSEEKSAVQELWKEFDSSDIGMLIHQKRVIQVQNDLLCAGTAPSDLRKESGKFILGLKKAYEKSDWPCPDLIYLQLVDHPQKTVRTVQGFGMPLSFEFQPAYSLDSTKDSTDIHVKIVKTRKVRIIAGNDKRYFNQRIYKHYQHEEYVRLWFPLFPFPVSSDISRGCEKIEMDLKALLRWNPEETRENSLKQWVAEFYEKKRPPENLIFGTVEIGYRRKTKGNLSLEPWTKDLAIWSMAQAYHMSRDLFNTTLRGVLDQIGRLLASLTQGDNIHFTTSFSYGKIKEVRTYPISAPWPAAVPESKKVSSNDSQTQTFESVTVEHFKKNSMGIGFPAEYVEHLLKFNRPAAIRGVEAASHLFKAAIYPQELLVPDDDTIFLDTLIEENEVRSVCEEAAKMTGALCCGAYLFAKEPFPGDKWHKNSCNEKKNRHWRIRPPIIFADKIGDKSFWERVEDLAKKVVTEKTVHYLDESESLDAMYKMVLLPLELSDAATGILVLFFDKEKTFSNLEKSDLERRVPRWVYRIYMNQLILRNRFSGLTAQLRKDIATAKTTVESNCSASNCATLFIKDVLQSTVKRQGLNVGWLTLYSESATGPSRLERFWCLQEEGSESLITHSHEFISSSLIGPCLDACEKQRPVIYSGKKKEGRIENLRKNLKIEIEDLQGKGENDSSEALQHFLDSFRGKEESSTILTFPVIKRGNDSTTFQGAYTTILQGKHYYDGEHRKLLTELGDLLAENLDYVHNLDRKQSDKKFRKSLEELRKDFACADDADDVAGDLLRKLGMGKTGKASANLEIAEDIVFWFLSPESSKLVVRSTKGKGLDVFKIYNNCDVLPCNKHPFFVKEEKNIEWSSSKKTKLPRLKKGDFRLWTIPLGERTQAKNTTCKKICVADTRGTNRKWLITFPIVNAEARIFGVIDCLRDKPLPVEDENVLKQFLRRISLQFYSAFSHYHFKKVRRIRKELFVMTGKMLAQFQTEDVYQELVRYIREEFVCKDCDLFLDNRGKMLLRSTTRKHGPASDKDKSRFSVEHDTKKNEIMGKCLHTGKVQIKHVGKSPISSKNLSSCLRNLFSKDFQSERMVIPLKGMIHGREKVIGMLQLKQPLHHSKKNFEKEYLKKSLLFTSEDFRLGIDLGFAIQRIVQMVSLVEQQRLLLNELTHSLGQPLQWLRSAIDRLVGAALRDDKTKFDIKKLFDEINTMFDLVHEAKDQLDFLTRLGQHDEKHQFEQINLKTFVQECCDIMAKRDFIRKNRISIDHSGVRSIESLPIVTSWMRKTLVNLLDNAIKYSWTNRDVMVIATEDNQGKISIKVTNWGVGIPEEDQQCVFDPYFRSDMPDAKRPLPGTGIGLMIVKEAVKRIHKGRVSVTSIPYRKSEKSTKQIIDIEHETSFTIELKRKVLDSLANSVYLREKNSDGQPS